MISVSVSIDIRDAIRKLERVRRDQVPFAVSKALNDVGQAIQRETPAILQRTLDKPTPFTLSRQGMFLQRATKRKLEAIVGFKPAQSKYLRYQIEGGIRAPTKRALRLPSEQPLDAYGNLPPRTIATLIARAKAGRRLTKRQSSRLGTSSKVDLFYGDPGDGRPAGIYKRVPLPGSGSNRLIPLIVFPQQSARYERRVPWYDEAARIARREIGPAFARAMAEAMRTAR